MPLWRASDSNTDGGQPNTMISSGSTAAKLQNIFANNAGWIYRQGGTYTDMHSNSRTKDEILVAIRGLAGSNSTVKLGGADITAIEFAASSFAQGGLANCIVTFNEEVTITGSPTLAIIASNTTSNTVPSAVTATYISGSNTNRIRFNFTVDANAATYAFANSGAALALTIANTVSLQLADRKNITTASDLVIPAIYMGANSAIGTLTGV